MSQINEDSILPSHHEFMQGLSMPRKQAFTRNPEFHLKYSSVVIICYGKQMLQLLISATFFGMTFGGEVGKMEGIEGKVALIEAFSAAVCCVIGTFLGWAMFRLMEL